MHAPSTPMGFLKKLFGGEPEPFMEHPGGDFDSAAEAMEDVEI